jgi:hypothetical protein
VLLSTGATLPLIIITIVIIIIIIITTVADEVA